ncbi:hypothetical protein [Halobacterium noricense]|uniref:hypothetical protein n=1 Tax=Halobacterium noricense TaxID=223182 RepID=UPI001E63F912|nr:hypothetical protein [Halobacterium noricense]UHH27004.1 hypothetical protein LT974_17130 [Halobacterium noricense]
MLQEPFQTERITAVTQKLNEGISTPAQSGDNRGTARFGSLLALVVLIVLAQIPVASAHGGEGPLVISQQASIAVTLSGIGLVAGCALLKRHEHVSPTTALYGIGVGLFVTVLGITIFNGVTPDPIYTASSMPFPRSWYEVLGLGVGVSVVMASFGIGLRRWPTRPRYTFLGILMGLWVSYPYVIRGSASYTHPLGYLIVLGTPVLVTYVIWTDRGDVVRAALQDRVARHFGAIVTLLSGIFFLSSSGYLSFFWEEELPRERVITVLPVNYQLVQWDTLEIVLPQIPLTMALSIGVVTIVGLLSVLIGVNALLIAWQWRLEKAAGVAQGTAGTGSVIGACTCGCCGPLVAKIALLAAGPSVAAPLYWVFVDSSSPLSALFIVATVVIFTATLIHSTENMNPIVS